MGVNSSTLLPSFTVYATTSGTDIPPECPAHKKETKPSECPVGHGSSMSECPASIELKQSAVPETDIDPANMVSVGRPLNTCVHSSKSLFVGYV
jgi:hypothetical protein